MWIHEVAPERLAELFHHYHQALTPEISGKGSEGQGSWKEVSPQEKKRLIAAARLALLELESMTSGRVCGDRVYDPVLDCSAPGGTGFGVLLGRASRPGTGARGTP